ncbi:MAG TPA: LL-diaminopimelate aminotransferase [Actinomycetota bacterium]
MRVARRVASLPPYLFAELDRKIAERRARGEDIISLGVGDPDRPTPAHVVEAAREAVADPATHRYPSYYGMPELRRAVATWFEGRFGVSLDPDTEVLPLIGSKEGLAHLAFAYLDPGDQAIVPDPGYPVYGIATGLAGAEALPLPLPAERGFLPDWDAARAVTGRTRLLWLNFPTNPTAAVATEEDLGRAVAFAAEHDLLLAHDAAYSEITFDGYVAPSVLQVPGARDVAIEFHSLSKGYNMTGWRIGFAVGAAEAVKALATLKTNLDSGIFDAVQRAAIAALEGPQDHVAAMRDLYRKRRDLVVGTLNRLGWDLEPPLGSIYVWLPTPNGETSAEFADLLLDRAGVVVAPGLGYGSGGEGYVRISLTVADDRLAEAMDRVAEAVGR